MTHAKQHPKYPFQRVEQKYENSVDQKSNAERQAMEQQAAKFTIGTFNFLPPKPDTQIQSFTLALSKPMLKHELYSLLHQTFNGHWDGEPTRSLFVRLSSPMPLQELRRKLKESFADSSML